MSAEPTALQAGDLSFALDGADPIDIRWAGSTCASKIQVTVRDPGWGTVPPTLRSRSVEASPGGVRVTVVASHEPVGFSWRATIDADERGELTFAFEGQAERAFDYRRIGVCVLHPWRAYVGATYEATTPHGPRRGTFPMRIAPQARVEGRYLPMIEAFSHLAVGFPGGQVLELELDGELFELEDQRNWTDASFKTYPTPLARSEPRTIRAGERVRQRAMLRVRGTAPEVVDPGMPAVTIGAPTGRPVPPIGMSLASEPIAGAAHTRVELVGADPDPARSARAGTPIELALFVEPGAPDASRVAPLLQGTPLERVLVLRTDEEASSSELVAEVRTRLGALAHGVPFLGGTSTSFSELNRNPPSDGALDGVVFAISPQVHAEDERSVRETLEIQTQVLRLAHELAGARSTSPRSASPLISTHRSPRRGPSGASRR